MAVVSLTKREVDAAKPSEIEWCLWDAHLTGFGLRVRPSGVKTYVIRYRAGEGRQAPVRRYTIGKHGSPWTPEQARREAQRILGEVAAGKDPAKQRRDAHRAEKEAPNVRQVAEQWLAEHVSAAVGAGTSTKLKKRGASFPLSVRPPNSEKSSRTLGAPSSRNVSAVS
jgi:hypothetical protein